MDVEKRKEIRTSKHRNMIKEFSPRSMMNGWMLKRVLG
jgi:hypothetical protein